MGRRLPARRLHWPFIRGCGSGAAPVAGGRQGAVCVLVRLGEAQKLLFGYSDEGDLTPLFSGYFDTHVGHKRVAASYQCILDTLDLPPASALFLSDVVEELDAAQQAGMQTLQLVREGTQAGTRHPCVTRFDEIHL